MSRFFLGATLAMILPLLTSSLHAAETADVSPLQRAGEIVQYSGAPGGIGVVIGAPDADLSLALSKCGNFVVQQLCLEPQSRDALRAAIRNRGLYGAVSVDLLPSGRLPYTENLVNVLLVDSYPTLAAQRDWAKETLRVLAPLGTAYLGTSNTAGSSADWANALAAGFRKQGVVDVEVIDAGGKWVRLRKPWPAALDQWTHYLHGADGNPVARDTAVGPPDRYQWIADPTWLRCHETDSSIGTLVTAGGRLFAIVDEGPIGLVGQHSLPDKWSLVARDAFNGVLLWKVPIRRWGWREWKDTWFDSRTGDFPLNIQKRLVATAESVYITLGFRAPVSQIDARTGQLRQTYAGSERTGEILHVDGKLILSLFEGKQIRIATYDAAGGKRLWTSKDTYRGTTVDYLRMPANLPVDLDPTTDIASDGKVVALIDGPQIVALDVASGTEKWRSDFPSDEADLKAGGMSSQGNLWNGTMIVCDGVVLHASPHRLAAFDAASGKLLWNQPKKYIGHLWYEWKDVFVIGDLVWTWSAELEQGTLPVKDTKKNRATWPLSVNGYDIHTGQLKKEVPTGPIFKANHHHRCYRNKATERYILASRRGTEFVDLAGGNHTVHNWVRGTCHVGMMPANGLQYVPPHPCQCYIDEKLNGLLALAARPAEAGPEELPADAPALERGPALADAPGEEAKSGDWPMFRHDALRSGAASTNVPDGFQLLWRSAVGSRVSPPIAVGSLVFVSLVDQHGVAAISAADGSKKWEFTAGARIDSPPSYSKGRLYFGSADGWVYCLRAGDGQLAWRFRAASGTRQIAAFGQLESAWPVSGSVLVQEGRVFFAAGRSSHLDGGITLYALDAANGSVLQTRKLEGPSYSSDTMEHNCLPPQGALPDILQSDGKQVYLRNLAFDPDLAPQRGRSALKVPGGFLDDTYFKRIPWNFEGENVRLLVHDSQSACYVRMFDSLKGLDPTVFFTPGAKGYLLFAKNMGGKRPSWQCRVPVRIRAMVMAGDRVLVAGPPDVVDPQDPLGAFEGRKGGLLYSVDATTGEKLAEHVLPSPPVFNGSAAAAGRLYLVSDDGSLSCWGSDPKKK